MEKPKQPHTPKLHNKNWKKNKNNFVKFKKQTDNNLPLKKSLENLTPLNIKIFKLKPFLKSSYNNFLYSYITCWQNLHNHYKAHLIGTIIKKLCRYEGLGLNRSYVQLSHNNTKILVQNLGMFTEHRAEFKFIKYRKNFRTKLFKKRLLKIALVIITMTQVNNIELSVYNNYLPINFVISAAIRVFKKEKKERYFKASLQVINAVFKGTASAQILGNLLNTYTRRNPRRIRFISFIKRLIDWHFVTLTGFGSKITGVRTEIKGRFTAKSRAKKQILSVGRIRMNEKASPVDYKQAVTITKFGSLGIKVWVCPQN
jgi:FlaA1/EpsC-like NDP-sugar epimerase